jgi:hypothetical protein
MIPLNQIFYGPPGTGKTYNVSIEAEKIINLNNSNSDSSLSDVEKFERISKTIREEYQSEEYKAKSNSIYRNDRAIMKMIGYLLDESEDEDGKSPDEKNTLSRTEAIANGLDKSPSTWSQLSQFISQFKFVDNWKETTNLTLNESGIKLKNLARGNYTVEKLKNWSEDTPQLVRDVYRDILKNQLLDDFTPILKTFFCALNMLVHGKLYKQDKEDRKPTDLEQELAGTYFDLKPSYTDLKWIGHIGRILEGLGIVEQNSEAIDLHYFFKPTSYGADLIDKIIHNWEHNYPELFQQHITYNAGVKLGLVHFITFHQSYSYEEFIEGIRPNLEDTENLSYELKRGLFKAICDRAKTDQNNNYVLIIDEINRGNVSKIFGELITLIEPTKRLYSNPSENPTAIMLPYSNTYFSVPKNVYIVGTMNTADRSITNLDTALRRRFSFKEFPPNPSILNKHIIKKNNSNIELDKVLRVLNQRIEYLLDKDHQIGHSYFMKIHSWEDLCDVFKNNIIPLLQEYFYNDWVKISQVLGDTESFNKLEDERFLLKTKITAEKLFGRDFNDEDREIYTLNENLISGKYDALSEQFFIKGFLN